MWKKTTSLVAIEDPKVRFPVATVPKKQVIALSSDPRVMELVDLSTGNVKTLNKMPVPFIEQLGYNKIQKRLALFDRGKSSIIIFNYPELKIWKSIRIQNLEVELLQWADDRYLLTIASNDKFNEFLKIDTKTATVHKLLSGKHQIRHLSVSERGLCTLAFKDDDVTNGIAWMIIDWRTERPICKLSARVIGWSINSFATKMLLVQRDEPVNELRYSVLSMEQVFNEWCRDKDK